MAHLYLGSFSHSSLHMLSALAGTLKDIQRLVSKPVLHYLGCVLRIVVLLEGEPSPQSEVLSALEQVFIKDAATILLYRRDGELRPKSSILVSSDHRILFLMV